MHASSDNERDLTDTPAADSGTAIPPAAAEPDTGHAPNTGKPEPAEPRGRKVRTIARHAMHPVTHVATLVTLHSAALLVLEKTPLLALLSLH